MIDGILEVLRELFSTATLKSILSFVGAILIGTTGAPLLLQLVAFLLILDTITGVVKAIRLDSFSANDLRTKVFYKVVTYGITLLAANAVAMTVSFMSWLTEAGYLWVAITEFASIAENVNSFSPVKVPALSELWNTLKSALGNLRSPKDD